MTALQEMVWDAAFLRHRLLDQIFALRDFRVKYSNAAAEAWAFARALNLFDQAFKDSPNFAAIVANSSKKFRDSRKTQVVYNRLLAANDGDFEKTRTEFENWLREAGGAA